MNKGKYIILLKFYGKQWKPYFSNHYFDYDYAKNLYDKLCKNYSGSEWALVKLEECNCKEDEFVYMEGD